MRKGVTSRKPPSHKLPTLAATCMASLGFQPNPREPCTRRGTT